MKITATNEKVKPPRKEYKRVGLQSIELNCLDEEFQVYAYGISGEELKTIVNALPDKYKYNIPIQDIWHALKFINSPIFYCQAIARSTVNRCKDHDFFPIFFSQKPVEEYYINEAMNCFFEAHELYNNVKIKIKRQELLLNFKMDSYENNSADFKLCSERQDVVLPNAYPFFYGLIREHFIGKKIYLDDDDFQEITLNAVYDQDNSIQWGSEEIFPVTSYKGDYTNWWSFLITARLETVPFQKKIILNFKTSIRRWSNKIRKYGSKDSTYAQLSYNPSLFSGNTYSKEVVVALPNNKGWSKPLQAILTKFGFDKWPDVQEIERNYEEFLQKAALRVRIIYDQTTHGYSHLVNSGAGWLDRYKPFEQLSNSLIEQPIAGIEFLPVSLCQPKLEMKRLKKGLFIPRDLEIDVFYMNKDVLEEARAVLGRLFEEEALNETTSKYEVSGKYITLTGIPMIEQFGGNVYDFHDKNEYVGFQQKLEKILTKHSSVGLALIELYDKEHFNNRVDPKALLRETFYENGYISQFLVPRTEKSIPKEEIAENFNIRVQKALYDLLSRSGVQYIDTEHITKISLHTKKQVQVIGAKTYKYREPKNRKLYSFLLLTKLSGNKLEAFIEGVTSEWVSYDEALITLKKRKNTLPYSENMKETLFDVLQKLEEKNPEDLLVVLLERANFSNDVTLGHLIQTNKMKLNPPLGFKNTNFIQLKYGEEVSDYFTIDEETGAHLPHISTNGVYKIDNFNYLNISTKTNSIPTNYSKYQSKTNFEGEKIAKPSASMMTPFVYTSDIKTDHLCTMLHKLAYIHLGSALYDFKKKMLDNKATLTKPYPLYMVQKLSNVLRDKE